MTVRNNNHTKTVEPEGLAASITWYQGM